MLVLFMNKKNLIDLPGTSQSPVKTHTDAEVIPKHIILII